ncbi:hypothetical protein GAYE_SCF59G6420 [Galdieria yellowstonensis]|uniref:Uncharacterized protein n=1 Tax=Galdieria yellowstonensis TaxID=3028027 RepID=A0AAV9ILW0_9RHOD|nr:hypothetical protein GAYE_SCF28MG4796 [Galdieria yellowstonensis]KAK4528477.1 hypothetical protein GAYE_SCF59G6420 [Galdieria yellowstonensis]
MAPRNLLIIDEHNALWQELGNDPNTWLPFFKLYARPGGHATWECKFVIATSQLHEFNLPSGYELSIQYVEPLSLEEFAIWENLRDYPPNLKDKRNEVADLTGLVPRMIIMVVDFANTSGGMSFEDLFSKLRDTVCGVMEKKHDEYVEALNKRKKAKFMKMLHKLFLGSETPRIRISDAAYRDRGLLIALNDGRLQFYNSIARDILFGTFSRYYFRKDRIVELSQKFKDSRGSGDSGGKYFEELFFVWCQCEYLQITLSSQLYNRTIRFTSSVWFRFDGKRIYPPRPTLDISCWIRFSENYPRLDYAYVDIIGDRWILYLIQASVSSFPVHNRDSARLELLLTKSETCQLESLLNSFFDDAFEVSPVVDRKGNIVNFTVTDSKGTSCRERICILYVTPLTRSEAKADSAPEFVEFLTFEDCPGDLKPYINIRQKVRSRRRSRSQRPVKRKKSEES